MTLACGTKSNFPPLTLYVLTDSFKVKLSSFLMETDPCNTNRLDDN